MKAIKTQQNTSWWQLCMVFVLCLLVFSAIRWQPEPWLRAQIEEQASQSGIVLNYEQIQVEGFTARLEQVSVRVASLAAPLVLDSLSVKPAWASLLSGSSGIQLQLEWQGQRGEALLGWQDDYIDIHNIETEFEVSVLQTLWHRYMSLPVKVSGQVQISGDVRLDMRSGRPLEGRLNAGWKSAGIEMADEKIPLGDYQLEMTVESASWRWILGGGEAVLLQGEGTVDIPADVQQAWPVSGQAQIEAGKQAGILSVMLGAVPLVFRLSGNAANPKLQRM